MNHTGYKLVNGVNHFYRIMGQGEPFVMLHGGPGMYHDELVPFFEEFADNRQLIFYDQRGNGKSLMASIDESNFNVDCMVADLEGLRRAFGLEHRFAFVFPFFVVVFVKISHFYSESCSHDR